MEKYRKLIHIAKQIYCCCKVIFYWVIELLSSNRNSLKFAFKGKFLFGNKIDNEYDPKLMFLLKKHHNCLTIGGSLSPLTTHPAPNVVNFDAADRHLSFALKNNFTVVGHYLFLPIMFPSWFFKDSNGNDISREELLQRMKKYIFEKVGRYKGKIKQWETLIEIIDYEGNYVDCKFLRILGEDYIKYVFEFARQADPDCEFCYSDSALSMETKRNAVVKMVKNLAAQGVKIDTIGMQGHCHLSFPVMSEFEKSIIAFSEAGCKVSITEMDMSVLPVFNPKIPMETALNPNYWKSLNPYTHRLPLEIAEIQRKRYNEIFEILLRHTDKIDRVTFWGISDRDSFKNIFPVPNRTDYPLLFDRKLRAKPIVKDLINI